MSFELNCKYHLCVCHKENVNICFRSKADDELTEELRNLMAACRKNIYYAQELQKQAYNKRTKPRSYTCNEKVWLNSKFIKNKYNRKLEVKCFRSFRVLHPISS